MHATDKDDGLNGLVKYYFVDETISLDQSGRQQSQSVHIKSLFELDENTGWISVSTMANLDYEQMPVYRLTVRAQDQGLSNSMPVYTQVIIYLNDVNDNAPKISLTLPSTIDDFSEANYEVKTTMITQLELSEWTMPDTFLAQVMITDLDSGLNGKLRIELAQSKKKTNSNQWLISNDFALTHLFNNIYSLMTKQRLDREAFELYSLNITVSDLGQPQALKTTYELTVRIKDENDNSPVFVDSATGLPVKVYDFNVVEIASGSGNDHQWIEIARVTAVDNDIDSYGNVNYSLIELNKTACNQSLHKLFQIDSRTGVVMARQAGLDRELCDKYEFKVTAKDNYDNSEEKTFNSAEIKMHINLIDLNDNAPVFEENIYKFQIVENMKLTKFARVTAFDADKPDTPFSTVKYAFVGQEANSLFSVDQSTGDLFLLKVV